MASGLIATILRRLLSMRTLSPRLMGLATGALALLLGTTVLLGRLLEIDLLVRVRPSFAPMHPSTAAGFLLCGVGLMALACDRRVLARAAGLVVFLGLAGILRLLLGTPVRVPWLASLPLAYGEGPMATSTSLGFVCAGAALVLLGASRPGRYRPVLAAICGAALVALGLVFLLGYLSGLTAQPDVPFARMALLTAVGLVLVGFGILALAWRAGPMGGLLPVPLAFGLAVATLVFSQVLASQEQQRARRTAEDAADLLAAEFAYRLRSAGVLVGNITGGWSRRRPTETTWRLQVNRILNVQPGIRGVAWIDTDRTIQWIADRNLGREFQAFLQAALPHWQPLLQDLSRTRPRRQALPPLPSGQGPPSLAYGAPLAVEEQPDGVLLVVCDPQLFLGEVFRGLLPGYALVVTDGETPLYLRGDVCSRSPVWDAERTVDFYGRPLRLGVYPEEEVLRNELSSLPEMALGVGFLLTVLLPLLAYLARAAGQRARAAEAAYRALRQETFERRHAEERIRFQASLLDQVRNAVIATDRDGTITFWNRFAELLYGWRSEEVLGKNLLALTVPNAEQAEVVRTEAAKSGYWEGELVVQRKDGTPFPAYVVEVLLRDAAGAATGFVGVSINLTERKQLEEQLRQALKLEAIGRLAGGVAHDFNNLLTIINGYSDLLRSETSPGHRWHAPLDEIHKAGERAASLTRQLLAYSRKQMLQPIILDLNAQVTSLERMLRRLIGEDIELVTDLDPGLRPVKADPSQLDQVLLNLASNARDAMPTGGRLVLRTANVVLSPDEVQGRPEVAPGAYVQLAVRDTGCGMDGATLARVFEPFFTTKEVGQGTGLGLAMVYGIVKQSGGHIDVASIPGQGTTFTIFLPPVEQPRPVAGPEAPAALPRGTETVLLVEDETAVRSVARHILQAQGYAVLEAGSAQEALTLCASRGGPLDLLLTDVVMPDLSGPELARRVRTLHPGVKVLYMSGYPGDALGRHGVLDAETWLLRKPFGPATLAQKVRETLDHPGGSARPSDGEPGATAP